MKEILVFKLMQEELAIDVSGVCEVFMLQEVFPLPKAPDFIEGVMNIRGRVIVVANLRKKFGMKASYDNADSRIMVCSVKSGDRADIKGSRRGNIIVGLIVDEVSEVIEISEKIFDPAPELLSMNIETQYIKGIVRSGERVIIVLDLEKIFTADEANSLIAVKESKKNAGKGISK